MTVRAAIAAEQSAIRAVVAKRAGGQDEDRLLRQIEQRVIFAGVYGEWPLDQVVSKVLSELEKPPKTGALAIRKGRYDGRH